MPLLKGFYISLLALIQAFQCVVLIAYGSSFFPVVSHVDFVGSIGPIVHPNRDTQIYGLGILFFIAILLLIVMMGYKNTEKNSVIPAYWVIPAEILVLIILIAGLNLKLSGDQVIARPNMLLMIGIILTLGTKVLLKWAGSWVSRADDRPLIIAPVSDQSPAFTKRWFCLFILISIFCISGFLIQDTHALFDVAYFWERQGQNQNFALGAAYWDFCGGVPGINGEAFYGYGLPVFIGQLCKLAGAFDWERIFQAAQWLMIAYTVFWFVLYTRIFRSPLLALAVWVLFLKFRFLSAEGGALFNFINLHGSPIRYYGDVFFLAAISAHWSSQKRAWLFLAGFISAVQLFLVTSTGGILCLLLGIYSLIYILTCWRGEVNIKHRAFRDVLLAVILTVAFYLSIMTYIYGAHLLQGSFWNEYFIYLNFISNGFYSGLYLNNLFNDPGAFCLSIALITLYLLSLWPAFCLVLQRQFTDIRPMMAAVIAFYGILHHQHFIAVSYAIDRDAAIGIFLAFIWYDILIEPRSKALKRGISAVLLAGAVIFLIHDPKWKAYPNFYHPKAQWPLSVDIAYFKDYFDKTYAFEDDVKLIQGLTAPSDHVPVISEHELMLLIKSHRAPFFYVFPLIYSGQVGRTEFPQDQILTNDQLKRTMDQIKDLKPPVIFVERKFFQVPIPAADQGIPVPLVQILTEVLKSYEPQAASPYLIAFKRKDAALAH
jgi:hypothetical protein